MSRRRLMEAGPDGRPVARWEEAPELASIPPAMFEPAYPPGPIERRYVTPEPRNGHHNRPASPAYDTAARIARSRANGTKRHVEIAAARRAATAQEDPPMPDPAALTPLERLADAARTANDALEEKIVALNAWDIAQRALEAAWLEVEDLVGTEQRLSAQAAAEAEYAAERQTFVDVVRAQEAWAAEKALQAIASAAQAKRQPGHHASTASEEHEKAERAARVMAAIERHGGDKRKAAAELGMKLNAVVMVAKHAGARLPGSST